MPERPFHQLMAKLPRSMEISSSPAQSRSIENGLRPYVPRERRRHHALFVQRSKSAESSSAIHGKAASAAVGQTVPAGAPSTGLGVTYPLGPSPALMPHHPPFSGAYVLNFFAQTSRHAARLNNAAPRTLAQRSIP